MEYTTTQMPNGLYVVRWTVPEANAHVTPSEDYTIGRCLISSVIGEDFIQLHGTRTQVGQTQTRDAGSAATWLHSSAPAVLRGSPSRSRRSSSTRSRRLCWLGFDR